MCRWCYLTPTCPCRRGGEPPEVPIGNALVAVARRLLPLGRSLGAAPMIVKTAFAILLIVSVLGIAACGDSDGDEDGTTAAESRTTRPASCRKSPKATWQYRSSCGKVTGIACLLR